MTPSTSTERTKIDRDQADQYLEQLEQLDLGDTGHVEMLVETPRPHRHAERDEVHAIPGRGFAGDHDRKSFYKGEFVPGREVSAMAADVLDVFGVDPVVIGDNLITRGFDLAALEPGNRVEVGDVVLERSNRPHKPCTAFRNRTSPEAFAAVSRDRYRGALFVVRTPGTIQKGDAIQRIR
jgi:MOSC domain-containing protein YiiM